MSDIVIIPESGLISFFSDKPETTPISSKIVGSGDDLNISNSFGDINISGNFFVNNNRVSYSGHTHNSSDINNFNSVVSGLLPTGTANYLSKFGAGGRGLNNSIIVQSGNFIGIGSNAVSGYDLTTNKLLAEQAAFTSINLNTGLGNILIVNDSGALRFDVGSGNYSLGPSTAQFDVDFTANNGFFGNVTVNDLKITNADTNPGDNNGTDLTPWKTIINDGTIHTYNNGGFGFNGQGYNIALNGNGGLNGAASVVIAGSLSAGSGNFANDLIVNGARVSITGHTHTSSDITDFNRSVTGVLPPLSSIVYTTGSQSITVQKLFTGGMGIGPVSGNQILNAGLYITAPDKKGSLPSLKILSNDGVTRVLEVRNNNNINIGNIATLPNHKLNIRGDSADSTSAALNIVNSGNSSILFARNDRKVGIGTNSPSGELHVIGSGIFTSGIFINNTPVSISGHTHSSSDISDFNSSVSGLINIQDISAGSGIDISNSGGIYTISSAAVGSVRRVNSYSVDHLITKHPHGFVNIGDSNISFDRVSKTLQVSPSESEYDIYILGNKITKTGIYDITLSYGNGPYFISFNLENDLTYNMSNFDYINEIPVSFVYYNNETDTLFFTDERLAASTDPNSINYINSTIGLAYYSGLSLTNYNIKGDGSLYSHATIGIENGTILDRNKSININHSDTPTNPYEQKLSPIAHIPVLYKRSPNYWFSNKESIGGVFDSPVPYRNQGLGPQYNQKNIDSDTWTTINPFVNTFVSYWICATNSITYPIVSVMGQRYDMSLNDAISFNKWEDLNLDGIPLSSIKPIYRLIYQANISYAAKARLVSVTDLRRVNHNFSKNDHSALYNLNDNDDHSQYVHLSNPRDITATHTFISGIITDKILPINPNYQDISIGSPDTNIKLINKDININTYKDLIFNYNGDYDYGHIYFRESSSNTDIMSISTDPDNPDDGALSIVNITNLKTGQANLGTALSVDGEDNIIIRSPGGGYILSTNGEEDDATLDNTNIGGFLGCKINNTTIGEYVPSFGYFTELKVSGIDVSVSGHIHNASEISGLFQISSINAGYDISVTNNSGIYTIASTNLVHSDSQQPQGFVNRTDSRISVSGNIFRIEPTGSSYSYYNKGIKVVKTSGDSLTIPNLTQINYIHFDTINNQISNKTTPFDFSSDIPIAYVAWNSGVGPSGQMTFFAEERHGIVMDTSTHKWIHNTFGMQYVDGLSIGNYVLGGNGSSNTHATISIGNGTLYQEDIQINVTDSSSADPFCQELDPIAQIPVYYHEGTTGQWVKNTATNYPVKYGINGPQYNLLSGGTWTIPYVSPGGHTRYFAVWILATNQIDDPIISIMGQRIDSNQGSAESNNSWSDVNLTNLPLSEVKPLYRLIFAGDSDYTNVPKCTLLSILDIRVAVISTIAGVSQNDHGSLFGLGDDDHSQYLHVDNNRTVNAIHNFANGINLPIGIYDSFIKAPTNPTASVNFYLPNDLGVSDLTFATTSNKISDFASCTSSQLATKISDETGSGRLVFNNSPTLSGIVSVSGNITINGTGVSVSGHTHTSSDITNFNSSVSGLLTPYQLTLTNPVTGTGTTSYLTKWISSSGLGNSLIFDNGTGVGIGNSSPNGRLHVNGTGLFDGRLSISPTSAVASPSSVLHVSGSVTNNASLMISGPTVTRSYFGIGNSDTIPFLASLNGDISASTFGWGFFDRGTDGYLSIQRKGGSSSWLSVMTMDRTNGNVGIGTGVQATTGVGGAGIPERLVVDGNIRVADTSVTQGNIIQLTRGGGNQYDYSIGKYGSALAISLSNDNISQRPLQVGYHSGVTFLPKFHVNGFTGAVGINTTTPSGFLDVAGDVFVRGTGGTAGRINFKSSTFADTLLNIRTDTNGNIYMDGGGAAIKCGSQDGQIDVRGYSTNVQIGHTYNAGTIAQHIRFTPGASELMRMTNSGTIGIGLPLTSSLFNIQPFDNCRLHIMGSGANSSSSALNVANSGNSSLLFVRNDGNIGIGITSPTSQLHVVGSGIFASGLSVTGLLTSNSGNFTNSLQVNGTGVSVSGHTHTSSNITDFNSAVSGLFPANLITGSGVTNHIPYWSSTSGLLADSSQLIWDSTNNRLGIGTTTPTAQIHVIGSGLFSGDVTASGSFIGGSGTASLPSFEFTGDPDTGLFSPAANTFGISTSGVERLRVDSVGNIGIGTVTPSGKLHVSGTIIASGGNSTNWNTAYGWGNHAGAGYITNYIPNGITIFGNDGYIQNIVFENDGSEVADITWDDPNDRLEINTTQLNINAENGLVVETSSPIQFNPNGGGNVGIGTSSPSSKLHVAGDILATGSFIGGSGTAGNPSFEFTGDPDTGLFSPAANTLAISTSGVERLRIANNGSISMSGSLNVDPQNAGQINCMYVNAGQSIGGTLSTDYLYVNQAISTIDYAGTAIALSDSVTISSNPGGNITLYDSASISSNAGANITLTDNIGISCGGDIGLNGYSITLTCDPSATIELNGVVNVNGDLTFDSYTESVVSNGNSGASKTLSLASGTVHTCTLTNNCTFTMPTATAGKSFSMFLNSGSGNYTASFSGVRWADSAIPTATITASKVDIYSFISDGTYWYGSFSQNYG